MFFSAFPYTQYEFPNGEIRFFKDISVRPALVEMFFEDTNNFETYTIQDGDTPETIAHDYFGDANFHWVVLLANNILNIYKDWPRSSKHFEEYLYDKYRTQIDSDTFLTNEQVYELVSFAGSTDNGFTSQLEGIDSEIVSLRPHHFVDGNGNKFSFDTALWDSEAFEDAFGNPVIIGQLIPVSIYDYEFELNEEKRNIILPRPEVVDMMKQELRRIVNE